MKFDVSKIKAVNPAEIQREQINLYEKYLSHMTNLIQNHLKQSERKPAYTIQVSRFDMKVTEMLELDLCGTFNFKDVTTDLAKIFTNAGWKVISALQTGTLTLYIKE